METETTKEKVSKADGKPEDWKTLKIKEIGEVILGTTPSTKVESNWDGSIPFITPGDVSGYKIRDTERTISEEGLDEKRKLPKNSIVVSCIGNIGRVGITQMETAMTNQQINSIIPYEDVADNYFTLFLTDHFGEGFKNYASQTTVPILNKTNFSNIELEVPPLPEQRKIASILTTVRNAIEQTEAVIQATRQLKMSMMKHLFTYGPVPVDQTDQVELQETEIGNINSDWDIESLEKYVVTAYGYTESAKEDHVGPKYLRITDISDEGFVHWPSVPFCKIDDEDYEKYRLRPEDIYVARIGATTGKTYYVDQKREAVFASYLIRIQINNEQLSSGYLYRFTQSKLYWDQLNSRKEDKLKKGISATALRGFSIPIPPLSIQKSIEEKIEQIDNKIITEINKKKALESLFNSLLENLMTAKVRVV
jgi:type I restriction enzyme S subunit